MCDNLDRVWRQESNFPSRAALSASLASLQWVYRTDTTGGSFYKVATYEELPGIRRGIISDLTSYYTSSYLPGFSKSKPGEFHTIELRLDDPTMNAHYRRGYYFGEQPAKQNRTSDVQAYHHELKVVA